MKSFEKFLFFYSIVAITVIFFTSAIFNRSPQNIISGLATLPLVLYFWLRLTSANSTTVSRWSFRFLVIIVVLCVLGIFTYFLSMGGKIKTTSTDAEVSSRLSELSQSLGKLNNMQKDSQQLTQELARIQAELDQLKAQGTPAPDTTNLSEVLLEIDKNYIGKIMVKKTITSPVDVYKDPTLSSSRIGLMEPNIIYHYLETSNSWYKVAISQTLQGWVNGNYVEETK